MSIKLCCISNAVGSHKTSTKVDTGHQVRHMSHPWEALVTAVKKMHGKRMIGKLSVKR